MSCEHLVKKEKCLKELMCRHKLLSSSIINYISERNDFDATLANQGIMDLTNGEARTRKHTRVPRIANAESYLSIDAIEECIDDIQTGVRLLIFLRGLPGSGKSHLARSILDVCFPNPNFKDHIHSADNFFMTKGRYMYDPKQISEAHQWNQKNVDYRMQEGYSPLFVDNTNTQMWEMRNYVGMAIVNGYKIRVLEMNTRWCFNWKELTRRNQHNVPKNTIQTMLGRYEMGITADMLLETFRFSKCYQDNPLLRRWPQLDIQGAAKGNAQDHEGRNPNFSLPRSKKKDDSESLGLVNNEALMRAIQAQFNNQSFEGPFESKWNTYTGIALKTLPPFLHPINSNDIPRTYETKPSVSETGTNTSIEDLLQTGNCCGRVVYGRNREITDYRKSVVQNRPGMLDKGCSTDDIGSDREEDLRKLMDIFKTIPPKYITEMYDDCMGNFDMTFEIFLEDNKDYSHLPNTQDEVAEKSNETPETRSETPASTTSLPESFEEMCSMLPGTLTESKKKNKFKPFAYPTAGPSASTGAIKKYPNFKESESTDSYSSDEEDSCKSTQSDSDSDTSGNEDVELNLGDLLVKQLEEKCGDPSGNFPVGFQPVVQVPKYLARQLYAFYIESVYKQMDNQQSVLDDLVREDENFARKLNEEELKKFAKKLNEAECDKLSAPPEGFREIMNEQAAMRIHKRQLPELKTPEDLATLLTKKKLFESFPNVDQGVIIELYHANGLDYRQTVDDLIASVGPVASEADVREPPLSPTTMGELERAQRDSKPAKDEDEKSPQEYREVAEYYLRKRNELYQKAQEHYGKGQMEVAQFYSQLAKQQTQYYDLANSKAASTFLLENSKQLQNMNTLDLHYLYVKEAVSALDVFIDGKIDQLKSTNGRMTQEFLIITGRGKRSANGVSRIAPAVMRRLEARKIRYYKMNPGLLKIKLRKDTPVTNDI